MKVILETDVVR